ncbi:His-Xaa-Ser system radical SAM maturase HxsB [Methylophilus sp. 13]|uniref:His-Xaa-Ser system radical SAM maturase HxsB n=1 Tax=Methylophilus sp. 13 TaxID=2781018 RepID=UPI0018904ECC|nr:His-Xaa-Ser system radical SAM maturase HxsB [Methylophilus sp. 13]MBF5038439.1 His-Xaa-Ser system radical SAM maturase HxsB [Methylophilus sp. 13]
MSKFKGIESYSAKDSSYELLPFKFDRFNDERYIITNLVGEYLLIEHDDLEDLVHRKLDVTSSLYSQLRSKHFIRLPKEKSPIELLALKLRTKLSRLSQFTNLHIFVVTLRCDHSCPYCQVSRQSEDKSSFDMTKEMADRSLDFVFKSPSPAIKIEFQGGEPLLNFELIKYIVESAEVRNQIANRDLAFVIATTLSLITDEMLDFCKLHKIQLSTSLDGPEVLHNSNRPRPNKDSYQRFLSGLEQARNRLGYDQVSALMTTTESSLDKVKDIIDEYLKLGFKGIFLRPLSPYGFAIKTKKFMAYNTERWLQFYKAGLDYIIELNRNGVEFSEYYSSLILKKILTAQESGYVDLMNPAGIGIAAIVFNYDGKVYASDESRMLAEMGDKTFELGNILSDSYEDIILSDKLLDAIEESFTLSAPMCSECAFEPYCGSEPVYHHAIHKDFLGRKPESEFCKKNMSIFKHLITLMENDSDTKKLFLGWANR